MDNNQPSLKLNPKEVESTFSIGPWAERYPPILSIEQAAELAQLPVETLRSWRSRKLLGDCSRRVGKRVRFFRDRFVQWLFNGTANRK